MFREDLTRPFSRPFVAEGLGGGIMGYAVCWNIAGESHLLNIAVHPDSRGLGVGEALVREAIRRGARAGSERIHLEVRVGNDPAQALYRKCGFAFMGIRKKYYTDTGEDALLLSREIRPADAT
jgi:ribosomal-protein-alanine N-acetyltransferase